MSTLPFRSEAAKNAVSFVTPLALRTLLYERHLRGYGIGAPKSGTTSLGYMFSPAYRARHEPGLRSALHVLARFEGQQPSGRDVRHFLRTRDKRYWLEFESSWVLGRMVTALSETFPDARYVLAVRDPYGWLDSMMNAMLNFYPPERLRRDPGCFLWMQVWMQIVRRPALLEYSAQDEPLRARNIFPLRSLLESWAKHHEMILDLVAPERVCALRTADIAQEAPRIAEFLGIPGKSINLGRTHERVAPNRHFVLGLLDPNYLDDQVQERCGHLMRRWYPDMKSCPRNLLASPS